MAQGPPSGSQGEALRRYEAVVELPMLVLGLLWLGMFIVELVRGLNLTLETLTTVVWIVFILDFCIRLALARDSLRFVREEWLVVMSLLLPALRVLRIAPLLQVMRTGSAVRSLRLARLVTALHRGMRALGHSLRQRGFGYVVALTVLITFGGAAGMLSFERHLAGPGMGLRTYGDALWWTAMLMTTMGSDYWPRTWEGRLLCVLLAVYAFAVFGYVTAVLASFFVGWDAQSPGGDVAGAKALAELQAEVAALRRELRPPRDQDAA